MGVGPDVVLMFAALTGAPLTMESMSSAMVAAVAAVEAARHVSAGESVAVGGIDDD